MTKKTVSFSRKPSADHSPLLANMPDAPPSPIAADTHKIQPETPRSKPGARAAPAFNPLGYVLYGPVFCISYGLVFTAILLGNIIPGTRYIVRGMHDGADAAQRTLKP